MQIQTEDQQIIDFYNALQRGKKGFEEAGLILVALIDQDASIKVRIMEQHPDVSADVLETFERIGRKQLYYQLVMCDSPGIKALRRCPYSEQVRYNEEPIPMLLLSGKDLTDHINVQVISMNADQARQVFSASHVRPLEEQRAYLERRRSKPQPLKRREPYTIGKGRITFHEPVTLTTADMARLISEMAL